jgi:hypothetical protein
LLFERKKADEKLTELKQDRELMTLTAPADGIVYYGRCVRGKWPAAGELASRLRAGGAVQPREIVMTIVGDGNLFVRASIPEKDLAKVQPGTSGTAVPAAFANSRLAVVAAEPRGGCEALPSAGPASLSRWMAACQYGAARGTVMTYWAREPKLCAEGTSSGTGECHCSSV